MYVILGCTAQICLLAAVLCESPAIVCPFPVSTAGGLLLWVVCALSFVSVVISMSNLFCCVRVLVFHLGGCMRSTSLASSLAVW